MWVRSHCFHFFFLVSVCLGKRVTRKSWERYKLSCDRLLRALPTCHASTKPVRTIHHSPIMSIVLGVYSNQPFVCAYFLLGVFDVLAYTDKDVAVPFTWIESDPKLIANPQMVKLHSFDTKVSLQWYFWFGWIDKLWLAIVDVMCLLGLCRFTRLTLLCHTRMTNGMSSREKAAFLHEQ